MSNQVEVTQQAQVTVDVAQAASTVVEVVQPQPATVEVSAVGVQGIQGIQGPTGPQGPQGDTGPAGPGVPTGGTTAQFLRKASATDFDMEWATLETPTAEWGTITGTLADQTDLNLALGDKVPYTGANANVDLGAFNLIATDVLANGALKVFDGVDDYASLSYQGESFELLDADASFADLAMNNLSAEGISFSALTGGTGQFFNFLSVATDFPFTPTAKLHIDAGNATAVAMKLTAGTTTGRLSTDGFDVGITASGVAELRQRENLALEIYTNNTLRAQFTGAGNLLLNGSAQVLFDDGSASAPSMSFSADTDTGMYRLGANTIGWSTGNTFRASLSSAGFGYGTISPAVAIHGISTSVAGQGRFGYSSTQYLNFNVGSTGITQYNAQGSGPDHRWLVNGAQVGYLGGNGYFDLGGISSGVSFNSGGGGFLGGNFISGEEIGLYSYNGDEKVAAFDYDIGEYYYFNGALSGSGSTIQSSAIWNFGANITLTQTVTTETITSNRSVTVVINGTTYKLLARL